MYLSTIVERMICHDSPYKYTISNSIKKGWAYKKHGTSKVASCQGSF